MIVSVAIRVAELIGRLLQRLWKQYTGASEHTMYSEVYRLGIPWWRLDGAGSSRSRHLVALSNPAAIVARSDMACISRALCFRCGELGGKGTVDFKRCAFRPDAEAEPENGGCCRQKWGG